MNTTSVGIRNDGDYAEQYLIDVYMSKKLSQSMQRRCNEGFCLYLENAYPDEARIGIFFLCTLFCRAYTQTRLVSRRL